MGILDLFRMNLTKLEEEKNIVKLLSIFLRGQGWPKKASYRAHSDSECALNALVRIGKPSVAPLIDLLARHSDSAIDIKVINALGNIKDARAVQPLIAWWEREGSNPYLECIGYALEKIGGEEALKSGVYLRYAEDRKLKWEQEKAKQEDERRKRKKVEIRIQCEGCGVVYILGKDAAVLTDMQLAGDMLSVTALGGGSRFVNGPERPDDVAHIKSSWDQWADTHREQQQQTEIQRILKATSVQWWKCWKCHRVQPYRIS